MTTLRSSLMPSLVKTSPFFSYFTKIPWIFPGQNTFQASLQVHSHRSTVFSKTILKCSCNSYFSIHAARYFCSVALAATSSVHKSSASSTDKISNRSRKKALKESPDRVLKHKLDMCSKNGQVVEALKLYDEARSNGIQLQQHHYNVLLYLCSSSSSLETSEDIDVLSVGLSRGFEIFQQMMTDKVYPNEATFTSVARLATARDDPEMAFSLVKQMKDYDIAPRLRSYGPALFGFCRKLMPQEAYEVDSHMAAAEVQPEEPELSALLKLSSDVKKADKVYELLLRLRRTVRQVSEPTAKVIEDWFNSECAAEVGVKRWDVNEVREGIVKRGGGWHGQGWLGSGKWRLVRTVMDDSGVCQLCGQKLVCIDIDPKETENFAASLTKLACEREVKAEFNRFQEWLERHGPFDAVIDGANVGLINQHHFSFIQIRMSVSRDGLKLHMPPPYSVVIQANGVLLKLILLAVFGVLVKLVRFSVMNRNWVFGKSIPFPCMRVFWVCSSLAAQKWVSSFSPSKSLDWHALLFLFLVILCLNPSHSVDLNPQDGASLLAFKSSIQDPNKNLSSWIGSNCSDWTGIACENKTGRVVSIKLSDMNLSGQINPGLCNLSFLEHLILSQNNFSCSIPTCFGNLIRLRTVDLSGNRFQGVVPETLMKLENLEELVLVGNQYLKGPIPSWIGNFSTKLQKLDLGFNSFSGELPESLSNSTSLKYLDLRNNYLKGNVFDFQQPLVLLNLMSNRFSGTLPCFSACKQSLTVLNLANNSIFGGVPTCIASLRALVQLNLSSNHLTYKMSPRLLFSEQLLVLDLSNNDIYGPLPSRIVETIEKSGLVLLDLSHNRFSGGIPSKITELRSLQALFLSHNLLVGEIPARIGNLTYLQVIDLSYNFLSGSIPLNIVGCFQLLALILNNNNLSGEIQPELDALDSLKILDISNNMISGEVPLTLAGCKSLEIVDFSSNNLSGNLNDAITKWSNLRYLSLARNKFIGNLPSWLFAFEVIQLMDFSSNKFSGSIPDVNFNICSNFNSGDISRPSKDPFAAKKVVNFKVSTVVDVGSELRFNYDLSSAVGIDLSNNLLHGSIPEGLFSLEGLQYLNLSYNSLEGQLPGLENMQSVRALDLSHNYLSGEIPGNISILEDLTLLDLSYNCFSGLVSEKQGFKWFPGAFAGNPELCVESSGEGCRSTGYPTVPGKISDSESEGPISVWVFCLSAFVSFYLGTVSLLCSARARNYFLHTKA
ncbi:Leucine-rich repeat receptor-like protein CLAVATA2, partial [Cucurbita argyrosperma subsp. argyrosperma]